MSDPRYRRQEDQVEHGREEQGRDEVPVGVCHSGQEQHGRVEEEGEERAEGRQEEAQARRLRTRMRSTSLTSGILLLVVFFLVGSWVRVHRGR